MRKIFLLLAATLVSQTLPSQSDPVLVTFKGEIAATFPATPQKAVVDQSGKPYFYLAAKAAGLQVFDIQNEAQPQWVKSVAINQLENLEVMNAFQKDNLLYLALGNFFGNDGQKPGLAILDVADPLDPVVKDVWVWDIQDKGSAFVTVSGDYAYLAAMSQGLIILNVANPDSIVFVSQYLPDPDFPLPDPPATQVPNARGLAIKDDVAYLCYDAGGLRVISIADKANPKETGRYINATPFVPAGKQQAFNNIALEGNTAFVAVDYCGMEVLDISDTSNIAQTSWWNPWQCQSISNLWIGSPGHTNQIELDTASRLVFLSSAQSELSIVDVSDPGQPEFAGGYGTTDNNQGTWGMTLAGDRVFLVYIVAAIPFASNWAGVKIVEWEKTSGVGESAGIVSNRLYPNPFRQILHVEFKLEEAGELFAELIDAQGRRMHVLASGFFPAGQHQLTWKGQIPAGFYSLRLITPRGVSVGKVVKGSE